MPYNLLFGKGHDNMGKKSSEEDLLGKNKTTWGTEIHFH